MKTVVLIVLSVIVGYACGSYYSTVKLQQQAVKEGAGEYILVNKSGDQKFIFIAPNCGPH